MTKDLPGGMTPIAVTLALASVSLGAAGCGTYRSENTVARKPPPATAAATATTKAATPAAPKVKPHPGWPKLVNCLAEHGFKVKKTGTGAFSVTTAAGTDTTEIRSFGTARSAKGFAKGVSGVKDQVGVLVATYGTTAGTVRTGIKSCAGGG